MTSETLLERLTALERRAAALEPDVRKRQRLLAAVSGYAESFLEALPTLRAYVPDDEDARRALAAAPIGEEAADIDELLAVLGEGVDRTGVNESSAHFFGFIPGSGSYAGALGDFLGAVMNRYSGVFYAAPGAVRLERQVVSWILNEIGFPPDAVGDLTSGGSIANLSGIVAARESRALRAAEFASSVVYVSEQAHHSVVKALRIAGMGECILRTVPCDSRHRMRADAATEFVARDRRNGLRPWLLVASGGTTDTGAVDPLGALADLAERERLWLHIDAAYGGAFALCAEGRRILSGIERADSLVLDPHTGLFLPFGTGMILVRDVKALQRAHSYSAHYLQDARMDDLEALSPSEISPELTRPFRGLSLWLALRLAGAEAFRAALEEKLLLARYLHDRLSRVPYFKVGPPPDLSVVTFRLEPREGDPERADALNEHLARAIQEEGRIFLSTTRLAGRCTLRLAILNARTHRPHVDRALQVIGEHADRITAGGL